MTSGSRVPINTGQIQSRVRRVLPKKAPMSAISFRFWDQSPLQDWCALVWIRRNQQGCWGEWRAWVQPSR